MDIVKKFNELKTNILKNTDSIYNQEMNTLTELLKVKDTSLVNIHNKNEIIADYEFKREVLTLVYTFVENGLIIKDKNLLNTIADLVIKSTPEINVDFCLQLDDLMKKIWILCIKILFYSGNISDLPQISEFISKEDIPDLRNICLSLIFKCDKFRSYDLENLSNFSSLSVLYDVVKIYKDELPEELKTKILINLFRVLTREEYNDGGRFVEKIMKSGNLIINSKVQLTKRAIKFAYLIFYEINFLPFPGLIQPPSDGTYSNEYLMLIYSLIVDESSAISVYKIFQSDDVFTDMYNGINSLVINSETEKQEVDPRDEKYLFFLLEVVVKILHQSNNEMIKITFMMFCDSLMKYSLYNNQNNDIIYEYLAFYCSDKETYLNISEFFKSRNIFTKENLLSMNSFSPSLIRFLWHINRDLALELAIYSLRSEDPKTVTACFDIFENVEYDISSYLLLNSNHIRRTILKSESLINVLINYQISKNMTIDDILLINVIMSSENYKFFAYAGLFKDFGKYMNDKFFERLINNIEEGLDFLENNMTNNTVKFIKNNEKWFNLFLTNNKMYYPAVFRIYEKMLSIDRNIEMSYEDGFLLLEVPESPVFRILSHKIINCSKSINNKYITNKEYKMDEEVLKDYVTYLKSRLLVGDNIESLVKYLISDYLDVYPSFVNEMVGFYKLVTGVNLDSKSESVLCTYDDKDTGSFIRNYNRVTEFEKIFLFMKIEDKLSADEEYKILRIIKDEITNASNNKMLLRQCLSLLLKLNNIDSIVRLIDDYEDKNLLLKINIRNIMTGGLYFNPKCVNSGSKELQVSAISLLYFRNVWGINALRSWISALYKECRDNEDMRYLVDDLNKKHDIEIY